MEQIHLLIWGRVQHVGFRRFVVRSAEKLNVSGWVRNRRDGAVEIFAVGVSDVLATFIAHCRKGPLFACVTDIQFLPVDSECNQNTHHNSFNVLETI